MSKTTAIVSRVPIKEGTINWALEDVEVAPHGPNEVLVEMVATGICHTDLLLSGILGGGIEAYPKVCGHEAAGYVRATGQNVTSVEVGDPVLMAFTSCQSCTQCRASHPAFCDSFMPSNYVGREGYFFTDEGESIRGSFFGQSSFAGLSVVLESALVNVKGLLSDPADLKMLAPLGCSFQTGLGALEKTAGAGAEDVVLVMGLGGVGMAAVMGAKMCGCKTIIALDRFKDRLNLAVELGATHTINTAEPEFDFARALREIDADGPSIVADTTAVPWLIDAGFANLRTRGKLVLIGVPPPAYTLNINVAQYINTGKSILTTVEGDADPLKTIPELIKRYHDGQLPVNKFITCIPARQYEQALQSIERGEIIKAVLVWDDADTPTRA